MIKTLLFVSVSALVLSAPSAEAMTLEWVRQFGSSGIDNAATVSADGSGNFYVSGSTYGNLGGPNAGLSDAYVAKYDAAGGLQWTRQFGTDNYEMGAAVSQDALGNCYVLGSTDGNLEGLNAGGTDLFVRKFDNAGNVQWTRQFGTNAPSEFFGDGTADALGNTYLVGTTMGILGAANAGISDVFVRKYDSSGNIKWTQQIGTDTFDWGESVITDQLGNVYVTGATEGSLHGTNAGGQDVFITKLDAGGNLLWTRQLGSDDSDQGSSLALDAFGNIYLSGQTYSNIGGPVAGATDVFLAKFNAGGDVLWTRQFGTSTWDYNHGIITDALGNAFVAGATHGSLEGTNLGQSDAFLRKFSPSGDVLWTQQFGTDKADDPQFAGSTISSDGLGHIYFAGQTQGSFGGPLSGLTDAFVVKFSDTVPEPTALALALAGLVSSGVCTRRRERKGCDRLSGK